MLNALSLRLRGASGSSNAAVPAPDSDVPSREDPASGTPASASPAGGGADNSGAGAANATPLVTLSASGEVAAVAAAKASSLIAMASIRAGELPPNAQGSARTPLEIVAVVDVSGSMAGEKMKLMKDALSFVVQKGMQADDSLGIVTFHSGVDVDLKLTKMNAAGKKTAQKVIDGLHTKGQTNLSGGLLQGLDLLAATSKAAGRGGTMGVTRSIILFTDGMANLGITDTPAIVSAAKNALPAVSGGCSIFTFGFGSSHNEDMLQALSEAAPGGQYFFTKTAEEIPVAFATALGGLVSVIAQNAELRITPAAPDSGVKVQRLLGAEAYAHELAADGSSLVVKLGDLYAEDEKDLLCTIGVPALPAGSPQHDEPRPQLALDLRYFDVPRGAFVSCSTTLALARPESAPAEQSPNHALEVQRNRIATAEALDRATKLADAGDVSGGRQVLKAAKAELQGSAVVSDELVGTLVDELDEISAKYETESIYRSEGRRGAKMAMQSHMVQRSAMASVGGVYEKKAKKTMKGAWFSGGS